MAIDQLNFTDMVDWARAAAAAYDDDAKIRDAYGATTWSMTLPNGVKVFTATDSARGFQWLSVRGTDDWANVREDAEYLKERDPKLGIYLHDGFHRDARAVYGATRARLDAKRPVRVTGHSLGGALAAILQAWLRADGFPIDVTLTFGQPKITDEDGVLKLRAHPLLRVVNDEDVVPMVPPLTLLSSLHGPYRHFGQELHLGPVPPLYKLYNEHDAETPELTDFWRNLGRETPRDHHVALYVAKLQSFLVTNAPDHKPTAPLPCPGSLLTPDGLRVAPEAPPSVG